MPILDTNLILIAALTAFVIILAGWIVRLETRMRRIMRGKNAQSLEDSIDKLIRDVRALKEYGRNSSLYLQEVEDRMQRSVQAIETIRYNPFQGVGEGGNQSFATAFVNQKGDGVVLTSLYSRERVSLFAKPVKNFSSEHELSDEEIKVIDRAKAFYSRKSEEGDR